MGNHLFFPLIFFYERDLLYVVNRSEDLPGTYARRTTNMVCNLFVFSNM